MVSLQVSGLQAPEKLTIGWVGGDRGTGKRRELDVLDTEEGGWR